MINLIRDDGSLEGTHGTFELGGKTWHSLEQPDLSNTPFKSCVPLGDYELVPWDSKKYGPCYVMVNEDLNVYQFEDSEGRPQGGRFLCLFTHRGNYVRNFQGCVGASFGWDSDNQMLKSSTTQACKIVNRLVKKEGSMIINISHVFE